MTGSQRILSNIHDAQGGGANELSKDDSSQPFYDPHCVQANSAGKAVAGVQGDVHKHGFYPHVVENLVEKENQAYFWRRFNSVFDKKRNKHECNDHVDEITSRT